MTKKFDRRKFLQGSIAAGAGTVAGFPHIWSNSAGLAMAASGEIEVGVLFSLTGGLSIVEKSLSDATLMAISEINAAGGVLGKMIKPIVEDGASDQIGRAHV